MYKSLKRINEHHLHSSNSESVINNQSGKEVDVAHNSVWRTFEVVFGIPFSVAILLEFMVPLSWPEGLPTFIVIVAGVVFIIAGISNVWLARRELARYNQPTDPGYPTDKLITTGVFSISRNPLYLGGVCVVMGIALALNLPWVFVLLPLALIICHYLLIVPEERYLAEKFGKEYHIYRNSVHRWIGSSRNESEVG